MAENRDLLKELEEMKKKLKEISEKMNAPSISSEISKRLDVIGSIINSVDVSDMIIRLRDAVINATGVNTKTDEYSELKKRINKVKYIEWSKLMYVFSQCFPSVDRIRVIDDYTHLDVVDGDRCIVWRWRAIVDVEDTEDYDFDKALKEYIEEMLSDYDYELTNYKVFVYKGMLRMKFNVKRKQKID